MQIVKRYDPFPNYTYLKGHYLITFPFFSELHFHMIITKSKVLTSRIKFYPVSSRNFLIRYFMSKNDDNVIEILKRRGLVNALTRYGFFLLEIIFLR